MDGARSHKVNAVCSIRKFHAVRNRDQERDHTPTARLNAMAPPRCRYGVTDDHLRLAAVHESDVGTKLPIRDVRSVAAIG
jgi:hypothetical protein